MVRSSKKWFVIINPTSGNNASKKLWPKIKGFLKLNKFDFDFAFTEYEKHSIKLVYMALELQIKDIICIGGDGTLHNVVNAIMTQNYFSSSSINVGVIPIGTGNDWVKSFNIPSNIESAINAIKKDTISTQDIGRFEFKGVGTQPIYFNNLAGAGFDGFVVSKVKKLKYLGKTAYLLGALISMFTFKNFKSNITIGATEVSGKTLMILIGLCKYSGGGMQLTHAPNAFDGMLDISIAQNLSKIEILKNITKLFNGKITNYKKVKTYKAATINVEFSNDTPPFIQADGELIGTGDFSVKIIPKAFSFYS